METTNASVPLSAPGRRTLFKTLLGAAFATALLLGGCESDDDSASSRAYATWAASPSDYNATSTTTGVTPTTLTFTNKTLRHTMQTSLAGDQLRVRFSNVFGKAALEIAGAHVALGTGGAAIDASSDKTVTVGGQQAFSVPAGAEAWSDPVPLSIPANANLAVSVYASAATPAATYHDLGRQTTYIADGNQLAAPTITGAETRQNYFWVNGIDVYSQRDANVLVTFGDSITDGFNSTVDASRRYPNALARRFSADASARPVSVVNAGISGNRVLTDTAGPKGVDRFERDVLGQSGVTHAIILLGINDIGYCGRFGAAQCVTVDRITTGLASMVDKAKARGVKVYLATLTPFKGTIFAGYYNDAAEAQRQAVNAWIRANRSVDGVVDFDKTVQNPADPLTLLPAWDSGDHLHPNDAGYEAMANSINLALFR